MAGLFISSPRSLMSRLCCKSRKLQGHESLAKTRSGKQSPIRTDAIALSKSPVSLTLGDEAPHILTRKSRLQPLEFLIISAKRLLQHNPAVSDRTADIEKRREVIWTRRTEGFFRCRLSHRGDAPRPRPSMAGGDRWAEQIGHRECHPETPAPWKGQAGRIRG